MVKMKKALGNHAFFVVGYTEDSNGHVSGPHPVAGESSISRASQVCMALLWLEKFKWHALSIVSSKDAHEIACYRRFPPARVKEVVWDGVVIRDNDSPLAEDGRGRGARLAVGDGGGRIKHATRTKKSVSVYNRRNKSDA